MAYQEQDRVWVRHFQGFAGIWGQADPRLENALTATQSVADGGARPDSSTENYIKGLIYGVAATTGALPVLNGTAQNTAFATPAQRGLIQVEANIEFLDNFLGTQDAEGEAKLNPAKEMIRLRMEGRRMVFAMSRTLGMRGPRVDVFSSGVTTEDSDPFWASSSPQWP